jgi:hypothetical protein
VPYGGNPTPGSTDEVHFLLGDTDTSSQLLTDTECQYLIDNFGEGLLAAAAGARTLQAKFAKRASVSVGDVSEQAGDLANHYADLAAGLEAKIAAQALPTMGGVDVSAVKEANEDDSQIQPAFKRDQFDSPRAVQTTNSPFNDSGTGGL